MKTTVAVAAFLLAGVVMSVACEGEGPEAVIDCYQEAYAGKDIGVLSDLYADDYAWVIVAPPRAEVWTREMTHKSSSRMFEDENVKSVALDISGDYNVTEGHEDGTWIISGIEASLLTTYGEPAVVDTARTCVTLYVRESAPGKYQVFREVTFGDGDCAGWADE